MKVRKEQFLLPKARSNAGTTTKWIHTNRKTSEYPRTINCAPVVTQPQIIEGLPSAFLRKIKPDVVLSSNGEIIVSSHVGGPVIWQKQEGILRQALLNTEKDVKSGEEVSEIANIIKSQSQNEPCVMPTTPNTGLLTITAVTPQQLTPLPMSQVYKMSDYQVILAGEALPLTWPDNGKKTTSLPMSSLPPIKAKIDSGVVSNDPPLSFNSLTKVSPVGQNQYPTVLISDGRGSLPGSLQASNPALNQMLSKRVASKPVSKQVKGRKKPNQSKKIMIKPASSLLSQTALDYTIKDHTIVEESFDSRLTGTNIVLEKKSTTEDVTQRLEFSLETTAEPVALVTSNSLPASTSSMIITTHDSIHSFGSGISKPIENNLSINSFPEKTGFVPTLTSSKTSESIDFPTSSINMIVESVDDSRILITPNSCIASEDEVLTSNHSSIINKNMLIDSDTTVICSDDPELLHTTVLSQDDRDSHNKGHNMNVLRGENFHRDHAETILPSDIEHHEEHHTHEYTDNLLSQLSDSQMLPNISSSQLSSVLNALASSEKSDVNELAGLSGAKAIKESVKCEPTEFVKIESLHVPNIIKAKPKAPETKYRVCDLNKHTCFRCVSCMFLSLKTEVVEKHWVDEHQNLCSSTADRQPVKRSIKCLGCTNTFCTKYALQIHLIFDHNVITTEVHDLIATTLAANKSQRELKRQMSAKSSSPKCKVLPQPVDAPQEVDILKEVSVEVSLPPSSPTYQPGLTSVITQSPTSIATPTSFMDTISVVMSEPDKVDEQETITVEEVAELPSTPSFSLFSEIQLEPDKEVVVVTECPSIDVSSKKLITTKKLTKCPSKNKFARNKMKQDFGCEIRLNYRCIVENCSVRLSSAQNLGFHLRCHRTDSDLMFCTECNVSVVNWSSLTPHLWREHQIDIDLYSCIYCNYKCNNFSKLINNHVKIHGEERPFLCDICGKGFKTTKQLRNHKVIHRAKRKHDAAEGELDVNKKLQSSGFEHPCNICTRVFSDSGGLRHHTERVHNKTRPYLCTFCSHSASSKSSLKLHIRLHTGEKPFSCDQCEYMTADHNSLRRHKMRHSGRRPYQCPHCTYNSIQATTYKAHLESKHPGKDEGLMFSCPMCPFRTVKRDNYLAHKAEHDLGGDPRGRRKKPQSDEAQVEAVEVIIPEVNIV